MNNQISYAPKAREDLLEIKSFIEEETQLIPALLRISIVNKLSPSSNPSANKTIAFFIMFIPPGKTIKHYHK